MASSGGSVKTEPEVAKTDDKPPFRFYDNRQKYLAFVNTCNEKAVVAGKASHELSQLAPRPPALRFFDAGMGDGHVLTRLMASVHRYYPTVPLLAVAKEISLEDVRLGLEKMPDRFFEHPQTVLVITNLNYKDAPSLMPSDPDQVPDINWQVVRLAGSSAHEYVEQIEALGPMLAHGWQTKPSPKTGNPIYVRPTVLIVHREDYEFMLDDVIPTLDDDTREYDFILASQPWRAKMSATFKAEKVLGPLARSLAPGGRLLTLQSYGDDPSLEVVQKLWPGESPFVANRHDLLKALEDELGNEAGDFNLAPPPDKDALFQYQMHTLPSEIGDRIGTSTLFAAWNAVIYVNQVEDERLDEVVQNGSYLKATQEVLKKHGGLWFNDEKFVVSRRHQ
jgi:SAM-dependent methyltransferase